MISKLASPDEQAIQNLLPDSLSLEIRMNAHPLHLRRRVVHTSDRSHPNESTIRLGNNKIPLIPKVDPFDIFQVIIRIRRTAKIELRGHVTKS